MNHLFENARAVLRFAGPLLVAAASWGAIGQTIDKLDRIAQVLEKVLARKPDEVFLLEGHTDAVGSAGANLALSRERAKAVKQALTTYYVIPAENLKTVGLGERYLKIPTGQPEAENRRVSLARITPLVGQAN